MSDRIDLDSCEESLADWIQYCEGDFLAFATGLVIPSASGPRVLGEAMLDYEREGVEPFQRNFFEDVAPALHAVRDGSVPPCRRFWMERTKKAGKDSDIAVCILWLMAFAKRPVECKIVAACKDQADIVRDRMREIVFYNEWLHEYILLQNFMIYSADRLGQTRIMATDSDTGHGGTPDLLILNELTHAVKKWAAMETHYNNAAGVPRGVMIVATNAGYKGTKAEVWKKIALNNKKRWHMHVWDKRAPWLNVEDVREAEQINTKSEFERLFGRPKGGDNWASGKGDALSEESIDRVFREELEPMEKWEEGWDFLGGLDLGISHDHSGLLVLGVNREQKRMRVAFLRDWAPSVKNSEGKKIVDTDRICKTIREVYERFKIVWFGYDPGAGCHIVEQNMRRQGVWMHAVQFTGASKNEMAIIFVQVLESGVLESFESEILRRDLGKFDIVAKPVSGYRLEAIRDEHGHADVGTALMLLLPKAVLLMGGLPSEHSGFLMDAPARRGEEEEVEITDPTLLDILDRDEEHDLQEVRRRRSMKDPFTDLF